MEKEKGEETKQPSNIFSDPNVLLLNCSSIHGIIQKVQPGNFSPHIHGGLLMNITNWLNSLSEKHKTNVLNTLGKYGNPVELIEYIESMKDYVLQTKEYEVQIDKNYYVQRHKKSLSFSPTSNLSHCFIVREDHIPHEYVLCIVTNDNILHTISQFDDKDILQIYEKIKKHVVSIDSFSPTYTPAEPPVLGRGNSLSWGTEHMEINSGKLISYKTKFFWFNRKPPQEVKVREINLSDIVWCYLSYHTDVESPTRYYLTLCLSNGTKHFIDVYGRSYTDEYNALFYMALYLKDNAPHILFNFSNEYKKLYKQSPTSLTLLAQNSPNGSLKLSEWKQQKGLL